MVGRMKYILNNHRLRNLNVIALLLLMSNTFYANNDSIVYVWDFGVNKSEIREIGKWLTEDFETELIQSNRYLVLERRKYNQIVMQRGMQARISGIESIPEESKEKLLEKQAGVVVFGNVKDDMESGEVEVTVRFERLADANIIKKESVLIPRGMINDNLTRKKYMKMLVEQIHAEEIYALNKQIYEKVSGVYKTYLLRARNLQLRSSQVAELAFHDQRYFDDLNIHLVKYNIIFDSINNNMDRWVENLAKNWGDKHARECRSVHDQLMNNLHKPYVWKLNESFQEIGHFYYKPPAKKERDRIIKRITEDVRRSTSEIDRQINILEPMVNSFLKNLEEDM